MKGNNEQKMYNKKAAIGIHLPPVFSRFMQPCSRSKIHLLPFCTNAHTIFTQI